MRTYVCPQSAIHGAVLELQHMQASHFLHYYTPPYLNGALLRVEGLSLANLYNSYTTTGCSISWTFCFLELQLKIIKNAARQLLIVCHVTNLIPGPAGKIKAGQMKKHQSCCP